MRNRLFFFGLALVLLSAHVRFDAFGLSALWDANCRLRDFNVPYYELVCLVVLIGFVTRLARAGVSPSSSAVAVILLTTFLACSWIISSRAMQTPLSLMLDVCNRCGGGRLLTFAGDSMNQANEAFMEHLRQYGSVTFYGPSPIVNSGEHIQAHCGLAPCKLWLSKVFVLSAAFALMVQRLRMVVAVLSSFVVVLWAVPLIVKGAYRLYPAGLVSGSVAYDIGFFWEAIIGLFMATVIVVVYRRWRDR